MDNANCEVQLRHYLVLLATDCIWRCRTLHCVMLYLIHSLVLSVADVCSVTISYSIRHFRGSHRWQNALKLLLNTNTMFKNLVTLSAWWEQIASRARKYHCSGGKKSCPEQYFAQESPPLGKFPQIGKHQYFWPRISPQMLDRFWAAPELGNFW
jgi:hypothetical protein